MTYTKKEREEYNEQRERACKQLNITKNQFNWLRRKGNSLHKHYEDNCNGLFLSEENYDCVVNRLYDEINAYVLKLNLFIYYQTDPRGATIYLDIRPIPGDSYNNATCIY